VNPLFLLIDFLKMGHFLRIALLVLLSTPVLLAQSKLFAPGDCSREAEVIVQGHVEIVKLDFSEIDTLIVHMGDEIAFELNFDPSEHWKQWQTAHNYDFGKDRGDMVMIADLSALHPYLRDKIITLIGICKDRGIELAVVETYRTHAKQHEYKSMGRRFTRSGAGKSKHQYGLAVDIVPIVNGKAEWHNLALWRRIGYAGERLGLRWGGRWRRIFDPGHFEWTNGLSSADLSKGSLPYVPHKEQNYPCLEDDLQHLSRMWSAWESAQSFYASNPVK
jgi:hypothetical protein